jgi:hypothetical protein
MDPVILVCLTVVIVLIGLVALVMRNRRAR